MQRAESAAPMVKVELSNDKREATHLFALASSELSQISHREYHWVDALPRSKAIL